MTTEPFLRTRQLQKRYGNTLALRGVSFDVAAGELFGLLGPNGAGKSTLLSILSGLLAADEGESWLAGERMEPNQRELRRLLGIVPQELAIYGELTAKENLEFFGRLYGIDGPELQLRVQRTLAAMGLEGRAHDRVETFSGGMKRRLNLGAALIHEPKLILLDEPTTGVDPQSRNHIFEEIRRLNDAGVTILYTSHYMEEVQSLCTRIGIMDHGQIVAMGTLSELLGRLAGTLTLDLPRSEPSLVDELRELDGLHVQASSDGMAYTLTHRDISALVLPIAQRLSTRGLDATRLRVQEPTLERVFLHLTGRGLRD